MDPINPIAGNPEALNQKPEVYETKQSKSDSITIVAMAVFVLLALGAVAFLYYQNQQLKGILASYQTTPSPAPTATADPTANWKTYTDSVHNISFKYPDTWTLDDKNANVDQNAQLILTKEQAKIAMALNMYGIGGAGRDYQGEPVVFSGLNLYEYKVAQSYNNTQIIGLTDSLTKSLGFFQFNGKTYSITLTYPDSYDQDQTGQILKGEFDQILSTFQFTGTGTGQ